MAIVFNELRAHHLTLKRSKCSFGTTSVAYLGHVISADGVAMDADKVAAVSAWPPPHSPRALRGFLGLAGYYRKFIREFGLIAAPLTRLLRRDAFAWEDEATTAFEALKGALTTGPSSRCPTSTARSWWTVTPRALGSAPCFIRAMGPSLSSAGLSLHAILSWRHTSGSSLALYRPFVTGGHTCGDGPSTFARTTTA